MNSFSAEMANWRLRYPVRRLAAPRTRADSEFIRSGVGGGLTVWGVWTNFQAKLTKAKIK